jgi:hypothetical protein
VKLAALAAGLLFLSPGAWSLERQPLPLPATSPSMAPRIAALADGGAVVTWLERMDKGHRMRHAVFDGEAFGPARTIASGRFFANWADTPGLIALPEGPWVAHWLERSGQGTYAYDVLASVSLDRGETWGETFSPHLDGTPTEHGFVSTWNAGTGEAGMTWLDGRNTLPAAVDRPPGHDHHGDGGAMTLRTARVDERGRLKGEALLDDRVCDCCATASAVTDDGPVVVYRNRSEAEIRDIYIVRQTDAGWSEPRPVHADQWHITGCPVNGPAVIARGRTVVVAWFTMGADESPRIQVAVSRDAGQTFDEPHVLDRDLALGRVDLAWSGDGFVLSWLAQEQGGALRLAEFDGDGVLRVRHELGALDGGRSSGFPRLLALEGSRLLIAWTDADPDTGDPVVRAGLLRFGD